MPQRIDTYIEPFVGADGMLFQVLENYPSIERVFINDKNQFLINRFKVVKEKPKQLLKSLAMMESAYNKAEQLGLRKKFYYKKRTEYNTKRFKLSDVTAASLTRLVTMVSRE